MTKPTEPRAPEPLLDLQRLVAGVRWRRRTWASLGLLGLLLGASLAILMPMPPTATVQLLVLHENDQPSGGMGLIDTDVALLESTRIAGAALELLDADERPEDFATSYKVEGVTANLLELTVVGSSDGDAVARARALADAFIADHIGRSEAVAHANAKVLRDRRTDAEGELTEIDSSIDTMEEGSDAAAPAELDSLYARRAELSAQISELGRRIEEAAVGSPRVVAGTQILDEPLPVETSLGALIVTNSVVGLVLGLVAGLGLSAVATVVRDRPILRREIAAHLGASVIAQVAGPRRGLARLSRRHRRVTERKRVAATLVRTIREEPGAVSVLELGCPRTAAALALDIAEDLAADHPVVGIDDLPGKRLRKLADKSESPIRILDGGEHAVGLPLPVPRWGHRIGVGSIAPGASWTDLGQIGSETVLVVRAGHANTLWLHTVARQLAAAHITVIGVVLVHPDPRDRSDGTLWNSLHTALRGRAATRATSGDDATEFLSVPASSEGHAQSNGSVRHEGDLPIERFTAARPTSHED